ncbi:MAG: hypothetical protein GVY20_02065 [Bacteroidetes bacterium]|nr:hypothetical protein [Bacteroidota bacterium]
MTMNDSDRQTNKDAVLYNFTMLANILHTAWMKSSAHVPFDVKILHRQAWAVAEVIKEEVGAEFKIEAKNIDFDWLEGVLESNTDKTTYDNYVPRELRSQMRQNIRDCFDPNTTVNMKMIEGLYGEHVRQLLDYIDQLELQREKLLKHFHRAILELLKRIDRLDDQAMERIKKALNQTIFDYSKTGTSI